MKYVRYQSKGNTVGLDDSIDDYWEIDSEGYVARSINVQADGTILKYDRQHAADKHGALPELMITDENLADTSFGIVTILTAKEFETRWNSKAKNYD